ncbi:MAG: hypothetical protein WCI11_00735 [Candidatus Methylumidiphilus sp.]
MATLYIKLYDTLNNDLHLPMELLDLQCEIECLKGIGPDDGEAVRHEGKYCITCPDSEWKDVISTLSESGISLIYSVLLKGARGESIIQEAGELNSQVKHYTTRQSDRKQVFAFWFGDFPQVAQLGLAA